MKNLNDMIKHSMMALSCLATLVISNVMWAQDIDLEHDSTQTLSSTSTKKNVTGHIEQDEHGHQHEDDHEDSNEAPVSANEHGNETGITLSAEKMALANIVVEAITPKTHFQTVYAPGEVKANGYKSYLVSPRTDSVVISRHASLGDHVEKGQKLVTLFSESMAQAQADYFLASTEWQRVKKLGKKTVSESRLVEAETIYNAAYGKLIAFGLTTKAIEKIPSQNTTTFGQYSLIALREGVVLQDDFLQGQRVNAGETVMLLADEKELWVEARVSPNKKLTVGVNSPALIELGGEQYQAKVIQAAHTIDPITRTRIIRLAVNNFGDSLHSGMFVRVYFQFETDNEVLAVPEEALIRSADGDWTVFVEDHPGEFNPVEVVRGRSLGHYREIVGLKKGSRVVTRGAFFVASEIAKGGFDPHNH